MIHSQIAELHRVASTSLLVDLGVDVVMTASASRVYASDPVARYLSHNVPSHPTEVLRCEDVKALRLLRCARPSVVPCLVQILV